VIRWDNEKTAFGHHVAELAAFFAIMGESSRAALYLDALDRITAVDPPYPTNRQPEDVRYEWSRWQKVLAVAAGAAIQAGDEARAQRYLPDAEAHAKDVALQHLALLHGTQSDRVAQSPNSELVAIASTGDGAKVADALVHAQTTARPVIRAIMARVRDNREALRIWARTKLPPGCDRCGVYAIAENVSDRREIARLVGDRVLEERWATVARRYIDALLHRDGAPERIELARLYERVAR
jgi:hypothetical protein